MLQPRQLLLSAVLIVLKAYRCLISPWLGNRCRFYPSCSEYAQQALQDHGMIRGLWLSVCRLLRCQPLYHGGYDPVPKKLSVK